MMINLLWFLYDICDSGTIWWGSAQYYFFSFPKLFKGNTQFVIIRSLDTKGQKYCTNKNKLCSNLIKTSKLLTNNGLYVTVRHNKQNYVSVLTKRHIAMDVCVH